jgi:hypothetical protein
VLTCHDCDYYRPGGVGHCDAFEKHARPASEDVSASCPMFEFALLGDIDVPAVRVVPT